MAQALVLAISNCDHCKQFEAKPQIPGMQPIICMEPMELVHVDYVGMEVTMATKEKPVVKNVLVVVDHFTSESDSQDKPPGTLLRVFLVIWFPAKTHV